MSVTHLRSSLVLTLFEEYYDAVYSFARRSLQPGHAEDIAQEVFMRLLRREDLEKMTISVSYLFTIADNLIKRRYQRKCRFDRYIDTVRSQSDVESRTCVDENDEGCEDVEDLDRRVQHAMNGLSRQEQEALRFIVCEGMSYKAAAHSLGVPVSTVNNWKYRGLRKLQDSCLGPELVEAGEPDLLRYPA